MAVSAEKIRAVFLSIDGVMEGASIFGSSDVDRAFFVDAKQIGHFLGDGVEVRLTRPEIARRREALKADARVVLRKNSSDWVILRLAKPKDLELLRELVEAAVAAHLPVTKAALLRPPPAGADLAKRRRFH